MSVSFENPTTGEIKQVRVGWSWILFLFSSFWGIPLFMRRLTLWGFIMLGIWALIILSYIFDDDGRSTFAVNLAQFGLAIFLGIAGNQLTAKNYLEKGWRVLNPDNPETAYALGKWGIKSRSSAVLDPAHPEPTPPISVGQPAQDATVAPTKGIADFEMPEAVDRVTARERWAKQHPRLNLTLRLLIAALLVFGLTFALYRGFTGGSCDGRLGFVCRIGRSLAGDHAQSSDGAVGKAPVSQTVSSTAPTPPQAPPPQAAPSVPQPPVAEPASPPTALPQAAAPQQSYTPPPGSPERAQIMDAMRPRAEQIAREPVIFRVISLKVTGNVAHAVFVPLGHDGQPARPYGQPFTLQADLERNGDTWTLTNMSEVIGDE